MYTTYVFLRCSDSRPIVWGLKLGDGVEFHANIDCVIVASLKYNVNIMSYSTVHCYGRILYIDRLPLDVSDMLYIGGSLYILAHWFTP